MRWNFLNHLKFDGEKRNKKLKSSFIRGSFVFAGGGGCHGSAWQKRLLPDRHQEQRLAFRHGWQQRFGGWTPLPASSRSLSCSRPSLPPPRFTPGVLRVWEASTARCVYTQTLDAASKKEGEEEQEAAGEEEKEDDPRSLTHLLHLPVSSRLATVTAEHNIVLYQLPELTTQQQVRIQNNTVRIQARVLMSVLAIICLFVQVLHHSFNVS